MDGILRERVRVAIAKIEIALGYDVNGGELSLNPNVDRAIRILEDFRETMNDPSEETPLEMLGLSGKTVTHLEDAGVLSVEELVQMTDEELLSLDKIREGRLREIDFHLHRCGLKRV